MDPFKIMVHHREHNNAREITRCIEINSKDLEYNLGVFKGSFGADKKVIGLRIFRNSHNSTAPKKYKGKPYLNTAAFLDGLITIKDNDGLEIVSETPLEGYGHDTFEHETGTFAQVLWLSGFNAEQSTIKFFTPANLANITDCECLVISLIYADENGCNPIKICAANSY